MGTVFAYTSQVPILHLWNLSVRESHMVSRLEDKHLYMSIILGRFVTGMGAEGCSAPLHRLKNRFTKRTACSFLLQDFSGVASYMSTRQGTPALIYRPNTPGFQD